jgi:uncharacterized membrane protein
MVKSKQAMGIALAMAAAGLLNTTSLVNAAESSADSKVHCYGVNKCKGHNDCKTASNACKGHAACKGQGFVAVSEKACDHLGGKVGK